MGVRIPKRPPDYQMGGLYCPRCDNTTGWQMEWRLRGGATVVVFDCIKGHRRVEKR